MIIKIDLVYNINNKDFMVASFDGKRFYRLSRFMRLKNVFKFLNNKNN
jgi:hypothetical protein